MLVTEVEAKEKWCPEARAGYGGAYAANRHLDQNVERLCLCRGSACMAWRFLTASDAARLSAENKTALIDHRTTGYCAKAGKP